MSTWSRWNGVLLACVIAIASAGCNGPEPSQPTSSSAESDAANFGQPSWESPTWTADYGLEDVAVSDSTIATIGYRPDAVAFPPQEIKAWDRDSGRVRWALDRAHLKANAGVTAIAPDQVWIGQSDTSPVVVNASTAHGGMLVGLDLNDGNIAWKWQSPTTTSKNPVLFTDVVGRTGEDTLAVTSAPHDAASYPCRQGGPYVTTTIDIDTGKSLWQKSGLCPPRQNANGLLLFEDRVLDARTGKQLWKAEDHGQILGVSDSVILWAPGAESNDNHEPPQLIDVRNPSTDLPTFPKAPSQRIFGQWGLLRVPARPTADTPGVLRTFRAGDSEIVEADLGDDPLAIDEITGVAGDRLIRSDGAHVDLLTRAGKRLDRWTADGDARLAGGASDHIVAEVIRDGRHRLVLLPIDE